MFGSFVIGILFGLGSKYVAEPIAAVVGQKVELSDRETGVVTFGAVMAVASVLLALLVASPSPFWLIIGGTIGVFGFRIFDFAKTKMAASKSKAADAVEAVEEKAADVVEDVKDATKF